MHWTPRGGKCPLPFVRSDLVLDGDVDPQGLGGIFRVLFDSGAGDFHSNAFGPDGRCVSHFELPNGIATLGFNGIVERWLLRVTAEYLYIRGAKVAGDTGCSFALSAGRIRERGVLARQHDDRHGYRPRDHEFAGSNLPDAWLDRMRVNLLVSS